MDLPHLSWKRLNEDNWLSTCGLYHLRCQQNWVKTERLFGARALASPEDWTEMGDLEGWFVTGVSFHKARRACRQHAAGEPITQPKGRGRKKGFRHSEETRQKIRDSHRVARGRSDPEDCIVPVPSSPEPIPGPLPREDLVSDLRHVVEIAANYVGGHIHEPTSLQAWTRWIEQIGQEVEQHLTRLRTSPPGRSLGSATAA